MVRFGLLAALFAVIAAKIDFAGLLRILAGFDFRFGIAMVATFVSLLVVFALRWHWIARRLGLETSFLRCFRAVWISQAVGEIGPPLLVGEGVKFALLKDAGDPWSIAASQFLDRLSGKLALLALVLFMLPRYQNAFADFPAVRLVAFVCIVLAFGLLGWIVFRRFGRGSGGRIAMMAAVLNPLRAPGHFVLSVLVQCLLAGNFALAAWGLGNCADAEAVFLLGPLLLLGIGSLPGVVSDWGKREAVAVVLLAPAGLNAEQSLAVSLLYGGLHTVTALPGAILWLLYRRESRGENPPGRA